MFCAAYIAAKACSKRWKSVPAFGNQERMAAKMGILELLPSAQ
jgi:hypothetical protein